MLSSQGVPSSVCALILAPTQRCAGCALAQGAAGSESPDRACEKQLRPRATSRRDAGFSARTDCGSLSFQLSDHAEDPYYTISCNPHSMLLQAQRIVNRLCDGDSQKHALCTAHIRCGLSIDVVARPSGCAESALHPHHERRHGSRRRGGPPDGADIPLGCGHKRRRVQDYRQAAYKRS